MEILNICNNCGEYLDHRWGVACEDEMCFGLATACKCPYCEKWYNSEYGGRPTRKYCSAVCNMKMQRERTRKASVEIRKEKFGNRICATCSKDYLPSRNEQVNCSKECTDIYRGKKRKSKDRSCLYCLKVIENRSHRAIYCSDECRHRYEFGTKMIDFDCINCGYTFTKSSGSARKYCTPSCGTRYYEKIKKAAKHKIRGEFLKDVQCKQCGVSFKQSRIGQVNCSSECRERSKRGLVPSKEKICQDCGVDISNYGKGNFRKCNECKEKKEKVTRKRYAERNKDPNSLSALKRKVNKTNKGCSLCGWNEARCDIHHINGRKIPDPHNHKNLTVTCPNCHRMIHEGIIDKKDIVNVKDYLNSLF